MSKQEYNLQLIIASHDYLSQKEIWWRTECNRKLKRQNA